ncbi:MAG: hypothetical protein HY671_01415 [Chloroflexi bacterium]|nr:hypothetical protein [Chloroflexota bacterium]
MNPGETFWGIVWGFVGGAVLTVTGSGVIALVQHRLEGRRRKETQRSLLKELIRDLESLRGVFADRKELAKSDLPIVSPERAREAGAIAGLPTEVYKDFSIVRRDIIALADDWDVLSRSAGSTVYGRVSYETYGKRPACISLEGSPGNEGSLVKAISALTSYLDC